ncbi:hypothetical protein [Burkholderia territorii]|uniref:hypothetical protein n=1 Tax=Burkholderia territorii TaxID=1503055 RepID=UPI0039BEBE9E
MNVTEKNNVQVCPPEFRNATPVVGLKLRTLPNGSRLSDTSNNETVPLQGVNNSARRRYRYPASRCAMRRARRR